MRSNGRVLFCELLFREVKVVCVVSSVGLEML